MSHLYMKSNNKLFTVSRTTSEISYRKVYIYNGKSKFDDDIRFVLDQHC